MLGIVGRPGEACTEAGVPYVSKRASHPKVGCIWGGVCSTVSSSRSVTAVKSMKISIRTPTETRYVRVWMSLAVASGVMYDVWIMVRIVSLARFAPARG
jgi:hypothetical protein